MSAADPPYSGQRHPGHPQVTQADVDAAVKAERERIRAGFFGCERCGKIHKPVPMPGIQADSWHSPDDGHPYAPHYAAVPSAALVDRLTAGPS